jgi:cytochrome c oxidase assembly factor CtaG
MKQVIYQWHFSPSILVLSVGIIYLYYYTAQFKRQKNAWCFWLAVILFVFAECSPLHYLGMYAYFSAHMISHIILLLICGPLLVISIPAKPAPLMLKPILNLSGFLSRNSWVGWAAGVGAMWLWHIPVIFDASMSHMQGAFGLFALLPAASMLLAGMLFSWPLFGPAKSGQLHPLAGIVYLFTACISCSVLGLLITFAPVSTYHYYTAMGGMASNPFNISRVADQQAAGLIMWVPCCFVYLGGCIYLLMRWFAETDIKRNSEWIDLKPLIKHND